MKKISTMRLLVDVVFPMAFVLGLIAALGVGLGGFLSRPAVEPDVRHNVAKAEGRGDVVVSADPVKTPLR